MSTVDGIALVFLTFFGSYLLFAFLPGPPAIAVIVWIVVAVGSSPIWDAVK